MIIASLKRQQCHPSAIPDPLAESHHYNPSKSIPLTTLQKELQHHSPNHLPIMLLINPTQRNIKHPRINNPLLVPRL